MRAIRSAAFIALSLSLVGCGGSGSEDIETLVVQASVAEDTTLQQALAFSGTPIIINAPSNGQMSVGAGQFNYTPATDFNGLDSALIEAGTTRYSIQIEVTPVNDAPRLRSNEVQVSAADVMQGQLIADDVEGDAVVFSIIEAPANGVLELASNGEFEYRLNDLSLPFSTFTVRLDDGQDSNDVTVELRPAYVTNADKAAYYYRSDKSHLRRALERLEPINDDVQTASAYTALAVGFAKAALDSQVEDIFVTHLNGQQARANALRDIADVYESTDSLARAATTRAEALQLYATFIADNGIENLSSSDASFLLGLLNDQVAAGDSSGAEQTIQQLQLYTDVLGGIEQEYSTAYGRLITAYRNQVRDALEVYQSSGLENDRLTALAAIERFAAVVATTGYQVLSRGDFAGQRAFRLAPVYAVQAVEYYFLIGELERAREQLAETLSYYSEVTYDYARPAKPYAETSRLDYQFPLVDAAAYFALLYPTATENVALALIPVADSDYARAENAIADAEALGIVLRGGSVNTAIDLLRERYAGDLRDLQTRLSRNTAASPYLGAQLLLLGYEEEAAVALQAGLEVLASSAYWNENGSSTLYMTGTRGCLKYVELFDAVASLDATEAAAVCERMALEHFAEINGAVSLADVMLAGLDAAAAWQMLGFNAEAQALLQQRADWLDTVATQVALVDVAEHERALALAMVAQGAVDAAAVDAALAVLQRSIERIDSAAELTALERFEWLLDSLEIVASLDYADDSIFDRASMLQQLRSEFYLAQQYPAWMTSVAAFVEGLVEQLSATYVQLAALDQVDQAERYVELLADARAYEGATNVLASAPLGVAEQIALTALLSERQALQDDFPRSPIATVDTDADGLANFLAVNASESQLADNDIPTDNDADNDGVADADDLTPLG